MENKFEKAAECTSHQVGCPTMSYQDVNVCIPVTIKAFGEVGNVKTQCLGKAIVESGCDACKGKCDDVCKFTVSQKLRVEVPIIFGARVEGGEALIDCGCAENAEECDAHCDCEQRAFF